MIINISISIYFQYFYYTRQDPSHTLMQPSLTHSTTSNQHYNTHAHPPSHMAHNQPPIHAQKQQPSAEQHRIIRQLDYQSKPCEQFGLDPHKLQNQQLLKHRSYRRLYNIIANDQTGPEQIFRPNLIKEMYFLLQITPFIQPNLRDRFLDKIQEWYNSNDHKKIQLSKNLDGYVKNVLQGKKQENKENKTDHHKNKRPKSGVQWDTTLNPFLRPYTAKIRNSGSSSQHKGKFRPQSSKFGLVSTMAETQQKNTFHQQTNLDPDLEEEEDHVQLFGNYIKKQETEMCDIQQEWQRSQDFKKKYRTLHPQEEPTYEKLMGLISKFKQIDTSSHNGRITNSSPFFRNNLVSNKRNVQSAIITRQKNAKALAEKQLNFNKPDENKQENNDRNGNDTGDEQNGDRNDEDQCDNYEEDENDENRINLDDKNGKYKSDARTRQGRKLRNKDNGNHIYAMINGVKILRPYTAKETNIIYKLDQYSGLEQNKKVIQSNQDEQCANKFRQYVRRKTMMKKQIVRRSQSKRYMDNFRNVVKIIPSKTVSPVVELNVEHNKSIGGQIQDNPILESVALHKKINQLELSRKQIHAQSVFDFSNVGKRNTDLLSPQRPYYNVRTYFGDLKKKKISSSCRAIHKLQQEPHLQDQKYCNKMTHQKRLFSQQKFDPLHKTNLDNYNKQALQEIEAIKKRFGGKITASTDALIKALYVDAPLPTQLPKNNGTISSRFTLPDKKYLMIQKQEKKKKRKLKKINNNKSTSKNRK